MGRGKSAVYASSACCRAPGDNAIIIHGAREHNLQNITVRLPLGVLVAVTGVSGSGKSSLVFDILDRALRPRLYGAGDAPGEHDAIDGVDYLDKVITIDQEHIGRIPRSNAATYSDTFTADPRRLRRHAGSAPPGPIRPALLVQRPGRALRALRRARAS